MMKKKKNKSESEEAPGSHRRKRQAEEEEEEGKARQRRGEEEEEGEDQLDFEDPFEDEFDEEDTKGLEAYGESSSSDDDDEEEEEEMNDEDQANQKQENGKVRTYMAIVRSGSRSTHARHICMYIDTNRDCCASFSRLFLCLLISFSLLSLFLSILCLPPPAPWGSFYGELRRPLQSIDECPALYLCYSEVLPSTKNNVSSAILASSLSLRSLYLLSFLRLLLPPLLLLLRLKVSGRGGQASMKSPLVKSSDTNIEAPPLTHPSKDQEKDSNTTKTSLY